MIEECRRLLDPLDDETLRPIAPRKMDGYTNAEIALRLGRVERTVERRLQRIRRCWRREGGYGHSDAG
jgi:DNA-directed RNA polymerase specialized sigma24 family protein